MQRNNQDYFSYDGAGNDKAFTNAIAVVANAPKIQAEREKIDREKQHELNKIYETEIPDFSFGWQKEQQEDMDSIADLGTKLTAMGYDPDSPAAMRDPKASEMYKEFQKKKVSLTQKSQASKYMQSTWDGLVKEIRNNPDKYADDAMVQVNSFYSKGLGEVMKGGKAMPDLERLEKPLDIQAWMQKVKGAIVPTQNGYNIERSPDAIEQHFSYLWRTDPRAKKSITEQYNGLSQTEQNVIAAKAIKEDVDPVYLYGRDFAVGSINGKTNKPLPKYITHPTAPKASGGKSSGASRWADQINSGDASSVAADINLRLQSQGERGGATVTDTGDNITIVIPANMKKGQPVKKVTVSKSDPDAMTKLAGVHNLVMGGKDATLEEVKRTALTTSKPVSSSKPSSSKKFKGVPPNKF